MIILKIFAIIVCLFSVLILGLLSNDGIGYDEYSKYKKTKDRIGLFSWIAFIISFGTIIYINLQS